jgi:hypothetical protein
VKVKLTYFKPSGKYYSYGEYETKHEGRMWLVCAEVRAMVVHPGLVRRWDGPILVEADYPHLLVQP